MPQTLRFGMPEVHKAPQRLGMYAWYGRTAAGSPDTQDEAAIRKYIANHTGRYVTPTLTLKARSTFRRSWEGELDETTSKAFDQLLGLSAGTATAVAAPSDSSLDPAELKGAVNQVLADDRLRQLLLDRLNEAIPILSSPLYVGITVKQTLRKRLTQHRDKFHRLRGDYPGPEGLDELRAQGRSSFAAQALLSGFTADALEVHCMPLPDDVDDGDGELLLPAIEYLLNRWHYPPFGRR